MHYNSRRKLLLATLMIAFVGAVCIHVFRDDFNSRHPLFSLTSGTTDVDEIEHVFRVRTRLLLAEALLEAYAFIVVSCLVFASLRKGFG
jgi:hypothetical protein